MFDDTTLLCLYPYDIAFVATKNKIKILLRIATMNSSAGDSEDNFTELNDDDTLDLPAWLESISSSCDQLHHLADQLHRYYIKLVLCYGYVIEPKLECPSISSHNVAKQRKPGQGAGMVITDSKSDLVSKIASDQNVLISIDSLLKILPHLNELCSIVEGCTITIEVTLKRLCYYLSDRKQVTPTTSNSRVISLAEQFHITLDTKIYSIFFAIMDLIYALISLDYTIRSHTNIGRDLSTFITLNQRILDRSNSALGSESLEDETLASLPKDKLMGLIEYLNGIKVVLICDQTNSTLFKNCLKQLQHLQYVLANEKTRHGYCCLREHFEDFILFFCENQIDPSTRSRDSNNSSYKLRSLNLIAEKLVTNLSMHTTSHKVFGISCLYAIFRCLYNRDDKKLARTISQLPHRHKIKSILPLIGSNCFILLDQFLIDHLPQVAIDRRVLNQMTSQRGMSPNWDLSRQYEQHLARSVNWSTDFKSALRDARLLVSRSTELNEDTCYTSLITVLRQGVRLTRGIREHIIYTLAIHMSTGRSISKNNLVPLYRSVDLIKSLWLELAQHRQIYNTITARVTNSIRFRWRSLIVRIQKRLLGVKYSARKLSPDVIITISNVCVKQELIASPAGRTILSLCLSVLLPLLTSPELIELNELLELHNSADETVDAFKSNCSCNYLYWNIPTFSTFYNHIFEEDSNPLNELKLFLMAVSDIEETFDLSIPDASMSKIRLPQVVDSAWIRDRYKEFIGRLANDLINQVKTDFLDRLCQEFEFELRVQTHRELCSDGQGNPFRRHLYNFKQMFQSVSHEAQPLVLRVFNTEINIRYYVELHLNKVAYNLTAIAPVDWYTYDRMMNLARHKYSLKFANLQLPAQTLDSGLDLLDITRNLSLLASRYSYDLTNQLFLEKCSNRLSTASAASVASAGSMSDLASASTLSSYAASTSVNQSLNIIRTSHITRSIHTHGFGLLDSAVNQTYQIMKRLINTFSKQMSDEKLAAVLRREHQHISLYKQQRTKGSNVVMGLQRRELHQQNTESPTKILSYEKVSKMAKVFKSNLNEQFQQRNSAPAQQPQVGVDLDLIRQTVTHLGNLLAFTRMLRSGAMSCATKSAEYVADFDSNSFTASAKAEFGSYASTDQLVKAADNLDSCLAQLRDSLSPQTDYLSIITSLFSAQLRPAERKNSQPNPTDGSKEEATNEVSGPDESRSVEKDQQQQDRRDNMRLFFILVPALTINYIEHLISCRERVYSRSSSVKFGALLCDDGFSMGVAFLLRCLGQVEDFQQFDWFNLVRGRLSENKRGVERRLEDSKYEEALRQTSSVTLRRLNRLETEYTALDYTLRSSLLLFEINAAATKS